METKNRFYIGKNETKDLLYGYYYDISTGEYIAADNSFILLRFEISRGNKRIKIETGFVNLHEDRACILTWDINNSYLGFQDVQLNSIGAIEVELDNKARYVGMYIAKRDYSGSTNRRLIDVMVSYEINPHYKKLEKKFKKENNQVFFRESLDGKINLWGTDYLLIKNASLEDTLIFKVYQDNSIYASASFNKSDCKFDHAKKNVELNLKYNDKYTKILDAYENTYDLIKLAPALTPLTLTKRGIVQIYVKGESVISSYSGGTYWETDVDEPVDDEDKLIRKYYFSKGPRYVEVNLTGFNYDINATYRGMWNSDCWNATSVKLIAGEKHKMECSIKFTKVYDAGTIISNAIPVYLLSSGQGTGTQPVEGMDQSYRRCIYDTYRIEIYNARDGAGTKLYQSDYLYGKNDNFTLAVGSELYPMSRVVSSSNPGTFNLGNYVVEYQLFGRLLCDVDITTDGVHTYDLPYDDFATARRNYRKCIGLSGFELNTSTVKIYQNQNTSENPTPYGMNDFEEYFIAPYTLWGQYFYPLSRHSWGNTSMWVMLDETSHSSGGGFENWNSKHYKKYILKNSYHISDVIKSLLAKIDPTIQHENTSVYSQFLYGHLGSTASALGNCDIYITQKTNILKGEYDQAAQKSEIKLKQVMDMLRDCFRCYWFIDSQNRFRIEHISYFMNGMSYNSPEVQFNLTEKFDKFNKVKSLYCQQEVEFDKTELISRYEFAWMDDVTDSMGNLKVDVLNNYIQKDKTEEINIDGFTSDIDYMLFMPDDFSTDGFALLLADSNKEVPIVWKKIKSEMQNDRQYDIFPQNWYASFNQLINHYMYDMPGYNISCNNIGNNISVTEIKKCVKHEIEFPSSQLSININKLITTEMGNGYIEEMSTDIDTSMTKIELRYTPV